MKETPALTTPELQDKHAKDIERIARLRLMDDAFMCKVFEDKECATLLIQIILDKPDLQVQEVRGQHAITNLQGRSLRLDLFAVDADGKVYNVEVQRSDEGAIPRRARYHSSLLDANITEPGEKYQALAETFVIFITEHDVLGGGKPIYHIDRVIKETGMAFSDDAHIVYVNAEIQGQTPLGWLMHDFLCTDAAQMHHPILAKRAGALKNNAKEATSMASVLDEVWEEGKAEGRAEGKVEAEQAAEEKRVRTLVENLRNMMGSLGLSLEQAMAVLRVSDADRQLIQGKV